MNARIEAAAEWFPHAADCEVRPERDCTCWQPRVELMREAIAAADAVMFSDEAVGRAAKSLYDLGAYQEWDKRSEELRELYREDVRAVIAALKGDA